LGGGGGTEKTVKVRSSNSKLRPGGGLEDVSKGFLSSKDQRSEVKGSKLLKGVKPRKSMAVTVCGGGDQTFARFNKCREKRGGEKYRCGCETTLELPTRGRGVTGDVM